MSFKQKMEDWYDSTSADPAKKKRYIAYGVITVIFLALLLLYILFKPQTSPADAGNVRAAEIIEVDSDDSGEVSGIRNDAGGLIADIDWDNIIGLDRDGNPIYGTFGLDPLVGGYDMCGAPILKDDMVIIGTSEDGLPIYDYSAIEQARKRGLKDGKNKDIDWNTIVGYDRDNNPIFGTFGADSDILGYDMLGNPLRKGSVRVMGRTDSGLPIYDYSTIETARQAGKKAREDLKKGVSRYDGSSGEGEQASEKTSYKKKKTSPDDKGSEGSKNSSKKKGGKRKKSSSSGNGNSGSGNQNSSSYAYSAPKGDKGDRGEDANGASGTGSATPIRGDKGPKGDRGESGENVVGSKGARGESGQAGKTVIGDKGERGESGQAGISGDDEYIHVMYSINNPMENRNARLYTKEEMLQLSNSGDYDNLNPEYEWWVGFYREENKNKPSTDPSDYEWFMLTDMTVHPATQNDIDKIVVTESYD